MGQTDQFASTAKTDDSLLLSPTSCTSATPRSAPWQSPNMKLEKASPNGAGSWKPKKPKRTADFVTPTFLFNITRQVDSILKDSTALKGVCGDPLLIKPLNERLEKEFPAFDFSPEARTPESTLLSARTRSTPTRTPNLLSARTRSTPTRSPNLLSTATPSTPPRTPRRQPMREGWIGAVVRCQTPSTTQLRADRDVPPKSEGRFDEDEDLDWDAESGPLTCDSEAGQDAWERGAELRAQASKVLRPEVVDKVRTCLKSAALDGPKGFNVQRFYRKIDTDHSGALDYMELQQAVRKQLKIGAREMSNEDIHALCEVLDYRRTGEIPVDVLFDFAIEKDELIRARQAQLRQQLKNKIREAKAWQQECFRRCKERRANQAYHADLDSAATRVEELERHLREMEEQHVKTRRVKVAKRCNEIDVRVLDMVRGKIRAAAYTPFGYDVERLFQKLDKDGSGEISFEELRQGLRHSCRISPSDISDAQLSSLFSSLDSDASGEIDIREIFSFAMDQYETRSDRKEKVRELHEMRKLGIKPGDVTASLEAHHKKKMDDMKTQLKTREDDFRDRVNQFVKCLTKKFGSLREAYKKLDGEGEGVITYHILRSGLERHEVPWEKATKSSDLRAIFKALDVCGKGTISMGELLTAGDTDDIESDFFSKGERIGSGAANVEDMSLVQRKAYWAKEYADVERKKKRWNLRGPPENFEKAVGENAVPVILKEKPPNKFDHERILRDAMEHVNKTAAKIEEYGKRKLARETEGATFKPLLSERSKSMTSKGYIRPGEPGYDDQYPRRRCQVDKAKVMEARECTFRPVIAPRSRKILEHTHKHEEWHERLTKSGQVVYDRMGNKTDEHVQERLEGFTFRPHLTSRGQRTPRGTDSAHDRLHHHGKFTHLEKTLRETLAPKDALGRVVIEKGFARPTLTRVAYGSKSSGDIPTLGTREASTTTFKVDCAKAPVPDLKAMMRSTSNSKTNASQGAAKEKVSEADADCKDAEVARLSMLKRYSAPAVACADMVAAPTVTTVTSTTEVQDLMGAMEPHIVEDGIGDGVEPRAVEEGAVATTLAPSERDAQDDPQVDFDELREQLNQLEVPQEDVEGWQEQHEARARDGERTGRKLSDHSNRVRGGRSRASVKDELQAHLAELQEQLEVPHADVEEEEKLEASAQDESWAAVDGPEELLEVPHDLVEELEDHLHVPVQDGERSGTECSGESNRVREGSIGSDDMQGDDAAVF